MLLGESYSNACSSLERGKEGEVNMSVEEEDALWHWASHNHRVGLIKIMPSQDRSSTALQLPATLDFDGSEADLVI